MAVRSASSCRRPSSSRSSRPSPASRTRRRRTCSSRPRWTRGSWFRCRLSSTRASASRSARTTAATWSAHSGAFEARGAMTRRRQILILGAALAAPFQSRGQQAGRVRRVGFLAGRSQSTSSNPDPFYDAFVDQLRKLGYEEGKNLTLEWRFADGKYERLPQLASELVKADVEVIVTHSSPVTRAAQRATNTIPIVMTAVGDPVGGGFARTLARPGGNITGLSLLVTDLTSKQLELLRTLIPSAYRVAVLVNPANKESQPGNLKEIQSAAKQL